MKCNQLIKAGDMEIFRFRQWFDSGDLAVPQHDRGLDIFMEIWAIVVIATLAGAIGSFIQKRGQERSEQV